MALAQGSDFFSVIGGNIDSGMRVARVDLNTGSVAKLQTSSVGWFHSEKYAPFSASVWLFK